MQQDVEHTDSPRPSVSMNIMMNWVILSYISFCLRIVFLTYVDRYHVIYLFGNNYTYDTYCVSRYDIVQGSSSSQSETGVPDILRQPRYSTRVVPIDCRVPNILLSTVLYGSPILSYYSSTLQQERGILLSLNVMCDTVFLEVP